MDEDQTSIWNTATGVTGPILYLYAIWILEKAKKAGITQLCFLARDALLPMQAIQAVLAARKDKQFKCHYIHGSRGTYLALGVNQLDAEAWDQLTSHGGQTEHSLDSLAACFMTSGAALISHWEKLGFSANDRSSPLSADQTKLIRDAALTTGPLKSALEAALEKHRSTFRNYLREQGVDFNHATAIIDTGWTTRSHAPLFHFLQKQGIETLKLFYLSLIVPKPHIPQEHLETFLYDESSRQGPSRWNLYFPRPFETLLFADHGRTLRFDECSQGSEPILAPLENPEFVDNYFKTYQDGVHSFLSEMNEARERALELWNLPMIAERIVARFWLHPTREEARVWATMNWEWDPQGKVRYQLSRPYKLSDAKEAFAQQRLPECYPQFWIAGSEALTPPAVAKSLRAIAAVSRESRKLGKSLPSPVANTLRTMSRPFLKSEKAGV